jgi:hypothetical protein
MRHARVKEGLVLTGVEVPSHTLLRVIVTQQLLLTLRTGPARVGVLGPQIDALARRVQRHATDRPRLLQPQNRFEQLRVLQPTDLLAVGFYHTRAGAPASVSVLAFSASGRERDAESRAPKAPRIAREALDAVARSWHISGECATLS